MGTIEKIKKEILYNISHLYTKYSMPFEFQIFPYTLFTKNNKLYLRDNITLEESLFQETYEEREDISSLELVKIVIEELESYQELYNKISVSELSNLLHDELMNTSIERTVLTYYFKCGELELIRDYEGAWLINGEDGKSKKFELQPSMLKPKLDSNKKEVLIFFSGGRDSMLATCYLIEKGYYVSMICFDNGQEVGVSNVRETANRIVKRYGDTCTRYLGEYHMANMRQSLYYYFGNTTYGELYKELGDFDLNQINCLTCRTAMYMAGILICKHYGISIIAEGARKVQLFAIEQEPMINEYKKLLEQYGIELLLPVYEMKSDEERKSQLLLRGFLPKTLESMCIVGHPMERELTDEEKENYAKIYQKKIKPTVLKELDKRL